MNFIKVLPLAFLITFVVFFSSCSETIVNPPQNNPITVEGRLLNIWINPIVGMKLKINDDIVFTDHDGKFSFQNVPIPYDLAIFDSLNKVNHLYKNITTANPRIVINSHPVPAPYNSANINVSLPSSNTYNGKLLFTNFDDINNYSPDLNTILVRTSYHQEIEGAVIVLLYEMSNGKISDYKHFGMKNITVSPGNTYDINFTENDLSFNPDETTISGNINQNDFWQTLYFISFSTKRSPEFLFYLNFEMSNENFSFVVPRNLPIDFYPVIGGLNSAGSLLSKNMSNFPSNVTISEPDFPLLIQPENNASDINSGTKFTFTEGSNDGIYSIYFNFVSSGGYMYHIITPINEFNFGDMMKLNFDFTQQQNLKWRVDKIGEYSSIDEYLTAENLDRFDVKSETRTFTTSGN
jgi:hypothetical protein